MGQHRKPVTCVMCKGNGYIEVGSNGNVTKRSCSKCNGTGEIR